MANLREIRERISSIKSTQQITKAMKMVAAAKLRKAQNRIIDTRPYARKLNEVIGRLSGLAESGNVFMEPRAKNENVLFVVVGSDRGLCGGFNNNLFRYVEAEIREKFSAQLEAGTFSMVCIGRKAVEYFSKRGYNVVKKYPGFFDRLEFEYAAAIMQLIMAEFENGTHDVVYLAFNEFKSVIAQNRIVDQLLPIAETGADADTGSANSDYIFEPGSGEILDNIVPLHLNTQLWKAVLESNAAEQGARMTAMDSATENASELMRELRLKYNQARQAAITTEISEIVSGAEALSA